jgi:putative membrane protein
MKNMNKLMWVLLLPMSMLAQASPVFAQARFYEWHWEMHPMWSGAWAIGVMLMMLLFWVLVIVGFVVGLRWLLFKGRSSRPDSALTILRERYARGEINKEEFEQKTKDLS